MEAFEAILTRRSTRNFSPAQIEPEKLDRILSEITGKALETISKDTDRDNFMSADEAVESGIIDRVKTATITSAICTFHFLNNFFIRYPHLSFIF